jgi:hypothetical protein
MILGTASSPSHHYERESFVLLPSPVDALGVRLAYAIHGTSISSPRAGRDETYRASTTRTSHYAFYRRLIRLLHSLNNRLL